MNFPLFSFLLASSALTMDAPEHIGVDFGVARASAPNIWVEGKDNLLSPQ